MGTSSLLSDLQSTRCQTVRLSDEQPRSGERVRQSDCLTPHSPVPLPKSMRTHDFQRMRIAVPLETAPGELRVALTPDSVVRLVKAGHEIKIQAGAGERAGFPDSVYATAGATILDGAALYDGVTLVCRVQPPSPDEVALMPRDVSLLSLLNPARNRELLQKLADRGITALALELVPRITRAQSMDVLSSQSTVAGYKAVLIGAAALPKFLPMLTTAAGTYRRRRSS